MGGLSFSDMQVFHQAWVLSRMRVEVTELPKWRDIVTVKTWIVEMQGSKSIRALEWYVGDKKLGGSLTYWVVLNTTLRKKEKLALPFEHFQLFPDQLATEKSFDKITLDPITNLLKNKTVELSDLDIVNHANNVKYLEWCLDCINPTLLLKNDIKAFDMNFLRELHWHDEIALKATLEKNPKQYTVVKNQKICFALELDYK
jgi:acyl-ACP thioesterase